jgi:hypothetical protein
MGFFDSDVTYGDAYNLPTDYKSGLADILGEAKKLYEAKKKTGYQTYEGPQIADFSPEEKAAMAGISGLVGAGKEYFDPATQYAKGLGEQFTADTAQSYMNPYQQSVVDVEKRKAREDFEQTMQGIGQKATGAGSFGGSRQAVVEGQAIQGLGERLGDIQAIGQKQAFDQAQKAFEAQKARERQAGSALASLGQQAPQQALKELTALAGVGEAGKGMEQAKMDLAYKQFLEQQQFPEQALASYQGTLYGYPYQPFAKQQKGFSKPSSFQNLMGVIGAGKSLFPNFGFSEGGHIAFRSQGGLSGMYNQGGSVNQFELNNPNRIAMPEEEVEMIQPKSSSMSNKEMMTKYLQQMLQGSSDVTKEYQKALEAQQKIANIKKKRLEERGFMDRLGEFAQGVAEGYDPTRPQTMTGSLAAGAKAVKSNDQILQERADIEEQLAKGQISLAEAKVKLANLGLKTVTSLNKLTTNPFEFEGPSVTDVKVLIEGNLGPEGNRKYKTKIGTIIDLANKLARQDALEIPGITEGVFNNLVKKYARQIALNPAQYLGESTTDKLKESTSVAKNISKGGKKAKQIIDATN